MKCLLIGIKEMRRWKLINVMSVVLTVPFLLGGNQTSHCTVLFMGSTPALILDLSKLPIHPPTPLKGTNQLVLKQYTKPLMSSPSSTSNYVGCLSESEIRDLCSVYTDWDAARMARISTHENTYGDPCLVSDNDIYIGLFQLDDTDHWYRNNCPWTDAKWQIQCAHDHYRSSLERTGNGYLPWKSTDY